MPWEDYHKRTANGSHRPLLEKAIAYVPGKEACLDIGAGALNDSKYLLQQGLQKVTAIDSADDFLALAKEIADSRLEPLQERIEQFRFPHYRYDLVNAQFVLPFVDSKQDLNRIWQGIDQSLKSQGIFCGQLFGIHDSWNDGKHRILFHTKEEVEELIRPYTVLLNQEEEVDRPTADGEMKHWHLFNLILQKKR